MPQSGSRHASVMMRAASPVPGGFGLGAGIAGGSACSATFTASHFQRFARFSAPLMIQCTSRMLDAAKGGVASAWMLYEMASRGLAPLALVLNSVNPIMAQGAAFGGVTLLAGFDEDITANVPHGALVEIEPASRKLRLR